FVHATATQRDLAADGIVFADLEPGNGLAADRDDRLLAGDAGEIGHGVIHGLAVGHGLGNTHVEGDLFQAWHLHDAFVAELFGKVSDNLVLIELFQTSHLLRPLCLGANNGAAGPEDTDLFAINHLDANAVALARFGVVECHVGNVDGHGFVDDATGNTGHGITLAVFLDDVDAFDQDAVGAHTGQDRTATGFVLASQDDDFVALAYFLHACSLTR